MFGWWKKNDGFEWREYVRTTILLKRKKRKDKIKNAGAAAVEGIKAAGKAGVAAGASGASAAAPAIGRSLVSFGGWLLRAPALMFGFVAKALGPTLSWLRKILGKGLGPVFAVISPPNLRGPLGVIGAVALGAALARYPANGLDSQTQIAGGIGLVALLLAVLPWLLTSERLALPKSATDPLRRLAGKLPGLPGLPAFTPNVAGGLAVAALVGGIGYGGWKYAQSSPATSSVLASLPLVSAKPIEGRAMGLTGDTLKVGPATIRLAGIDAPERDQKCKRSGTKAWPCGQAASEALSRIVRGKTATCDLSGKDESGIPLGVCKIEGKDVADELVRGGHVFAASGLFARYSSAEGEAKAAKAGVWKGDGERPGEWRAKRWEAAKRSAPDGCPIKGSLTAEGRVYVLPWSPEYDRVKIRTTKGERWFCTEQEARAAGWKAPERG